MKTAVSATLACLLAHPAVAVAQTAAPAKAADPQPSTDATDEVSVVGTKASRAAGSVHVLSKAELARFRYDDPHMALMRVPGVYVRQEDGFGLRPNIAMRGTSPDRTKKVTLMEDGVLVAPSPYSAPAAYYFPMLGRMESVRVIKGPGAIAYGPQTIGGAIDFVTRSIPSVPSATVDIAAGDFGYRKLQGSAGASTDQFGAVFDVLHMGSDGFKVLDGGGNTGFVRTEVMGKALYTLSEGPQARHDFEAKFVYADEDSNETYLGLTDDDFRRTPNRRYVPSKLDRMRWNRTAWTLTHRARLPHGVELTTQLYRADLHRNWNRFKNLRGADVFNVLSQPDTPVNSVYDAFLSGQSDSTTPGEAALIGPNDRTMVAQGLQTTMRVPARTGPVSHRIEWGTRFHFDSIDRNQSEAGYITRQGQLVRDGQPERTTDLNFDSAFAIAMHLMDSIRWLRLELTPGVRTELIQSRTTDKLAGTSSAAVTAVVLPGVGAYYEVLPGAGVLGGVHRGFSPPAPGDPSARPEDSINYEAGVRYSRKRLRFETIGFYNDYSNLTTVCTVSSGCGEELADRQFSAGAARILGVEAFGEARIPVVDGVELPLRVGYTYSDTELLTAFTSADPTLGTVNAGDKLPYIPEHQLSASAGVHWGRLTLDGNVTYMAAMREQASQGPLDPKTSTDEAWLVDASLGVRVLKGVKLYANLRNLLNEAYIVARRPFGARPNAPRTFMLGMAAEF